MRNDQYTVRNNGKIIGSVKVDKKAMIKLCAFGLATHLLATAVGFSLANALHDDEPKYPINVVNEDEIGYEPIYNGIEYTVKLNETLTGIVYSYESDPNKVYNYIDEIVRLSDISSASRLRDGDKVILVGVPESKLEDFGYSADYSLFEPTFELEDRIAFMDKAIEVVYENESNDSELAVFKFRFNQLKKDYQEYQYEKDADLLDELLNESRELSEILSGISGYSFDDNKTAYPLSEAINYQNTMSY